MAHQSPPSNADDSALFDLDSTAIKARYSQLITQIKSHDKAYYLDDAPSISDAQYDALHQELQDIEQRHPHLITADSPTQSVGIAPADNFSKITHAMPMLSLGNAFSTEDVSEFIARMKRFLNMADDEKIALFAEQKIDGSSSRFATKTASSSAPPQGAMDK